MALDDPAQNALGDRPGTAVGVGHGGVVYVPGAPLDNWKHRARGMRCGTCIWFVPKGDDPERAVSKVIGRCRRRAPVVGEGWPVVFDSDWCGDHKLRRDEGRLMGVVKTTVVGGHRHTWDPTRTRTSRDHGHSHGVSDPESGYTDRSGMDKHRHKLVRED